MHCSQISHSSQISRRKERRKKETLVKTYKGQCQVDLLCAYGLEILHLVEEIRIFRLSRAPYEPLILSTPFPQHFPVFYSKRALKLFPFFSSTPSSNQPIILLYTYLKREMQPRREFL